MINLDVLAGLLSGWLALCALALHVFSSPARQRWMDTPEYVRRGFLLTGVMFMWRSVNFFSIADAPAPMGHINPEGFMALTVLTYTVTAWAFWIVRRPLPDGAWARLGWFERFFRTHQGAMPTKAEVVAAVRARGIPAVAPGEGPDAVVREGAPR